jgi:uncharacterized RDD family membrane protein YckC
MRLYISDYPHLNGVVIAPLWRRILAALIDGFLVFTVQVVFALLSLGVLSVLDHQETGHWTLNYDAKDLQPSVLFVVALVMIPYLVYHTVFLRYWNGRTPGKNFMLVRVLSKSGGRISFWQSFMRVLLQVFSVLPALLGYLAFFRSKKNSSLHDLLAKTIVLREEVEHRIIRGTVPPHPVASHH